MSLNNGFKQVVEVLNPLVRDVKSVESLRSELAGLQEELSKAHAQVRLTDPNLSRCVGYFVPLVSSLLIHRALICHLKRIARAMGKKGYGIGM